jgi:hypothetical protein
MTKLELEKKYNFILDAFNCLADYICNTNPRDLVRIAIECGYTKKDILTWFIDNEELYNSVKEELESEEIK